MVGHLFWFFSVNHAVDRSFRSLFQSAINNYAIVLAFAVAVCGLPDARKDHALAMCRFAKEAMYATWQLTAELTVTLGPGKDAINNPLLFKKYNYTSSKFILSGC